MRKLLRELQRQFPDAEISTKHLSFLETGRAQPSREMVLRLAEELDVPLRERNVLLVAAGSFVEQGDIQLVQIESPYRSLLGPLLSYIDALDRQSPDDTVTIVLPEFLPACRQALQRRRELQIVDAERSFLDSHNGFPTRCSFGEFLFDLINARGDGDVPSQIGMIWSELPHADGHRGHRLGLGFGIFPSSDEDLSQALVRDDAIQLVLPGLAAHRETVR